MVNSNWMIRTRWHDVGANGKPNRIWITISSAERSGECFVCSNLFALFYFYSREYHCVCAVLAAASPCFPHSRVFFRLQHVCEWGVSVFIAARGGRLISYSNYSDARSCASERVGYFVLILVSYLNSGIRARKKERSFIKCRFMYLMQSY